MAGNRYFAKNLRRLRRAKITIIATIATSVKRRKPELLEEAKKNGKMTTILLCPTVDADKANKVTPAKIIRNAMTSSVDAMEG